MKTQKQIEEELKEVESDECLGYPSAQIQINAPLALVQVDLKARVQILK